MRLHIYLILVSFLASCSNEKCCDEIAKLKRDIIQLESNNSHKSYEDYIPEKPLFKEATWRVSDINNPTPGCFISEKADTAYVLNYPDWDAQFTYIFFQDDEGIRYKAAIEKGRASIYHNSFLSYILIPGQKVAVKLEICGSGGFLYITEIINLKRQTEDV